MSRAQEIELKLETDSAGASALKAHPLLDGVAAKAVEQRSTYFDTPSGALRKSGLTLRVRAVDGGYVQTLKQDGKGGAGLFDRPEWEWHIEGDVPHLALLDGTPAAKLAKRKKNGLKQVIRSEACRTIWTVPRDGGVVEILVDEGEVEAGDRSETIAEIELELKDGRTALLFEMASQLAEAMPLRIGVLTKAERGFRLADGSSGKATKAAPLALERGINVSEAFARITYACLRHYRLNESLIIQHSDAAALHQARVAMRRLRSAFSLFKPVIDDPRFLELREELRWFTNQLGHARNLDVMIRRVETAAEGSGEGPLLATLRQSRATAYDKVVEALRSKRLRMLTLGLVAWLETGAWRARKAALEPLPGFAGRQLDKRWKKVKRGARDLTGIDAEARHQVRIEIKKLRYASEFLTGLASGKQRRNRQKQFLAALETLQEELGELNDQETGSELLDELLADAPPEAKREAELLLRENKAGQGSLAAAEAAAAELLEVGPYWR